MKVIVAGLSKTGTKSMATALRLLGYEVYDWMENFWYLGDDWLRQVEQGFKTEDMRRMYDNVDAVTDGPCDAYWEEIFDAFPGVKVILTTREEKSWVESWKKQVEEISKDLRFRLACTITYTGAKSQYFIAMSARHLARYGTWPSSSRTPLCDEALIRAKRRHERHVKRNVPKEQLLVYEVREGWKPLCDFLGVPVPDKPFPYKNKASALLVEMRKEDPLMRRLEMELKVSLFCIFVILSVALYLVFKTLC